MSAGEQQGVDITDAIREAHLILEENMDINQQVQSDFNADKSSSTQTTPVIPDFGTSIQEVLLKLNRMEKKLDGIEVNMHKLDTIEKSLRHVTLRITDLEKKTEKIQSNFATECRSLKKETNELRKQVRDLEVSNEKQTDNIRSKCEQECESLKEITKDVNQKLFDMELSLNDLQSAPTKEAIIEDLQSLKIESNSNTELMLDIQTRAMRDNLVFSGIPTEETTHNGVTREDTEEVLKDFIKTTLQIPDNIEFERVHRAGQARLDRPRVIIAKFSNFKDRERVRKSAPSKLKGTTYGVNEQFPKQIEDRRKKLYPVLKKARQQNKKAVLVKDKLYIENELFTFDKPSKGLGTPWSIVQNHHTGLWTASLKKGENYEALQGKRTIDLRSPPSDSEGQGPASQDQKNKKHRLDVPEISENCTVSTV